MIDHRLHIIGQPDHRALTGWHRAGLSVTPQIQQKTTHLRMISAQMVDLKIERFSGQGETVDEYHRHRCVYWSDQVITDVDDPAAYGAFLVDIAKAGLAVMRVELTMLQGQPATATRGHTQRETADDLPGTDDRRGFFFHDHPGYRGRWAPA